MLLHNIKILTFHSTKKKTVAEIMLFQRYANLVLLVLVGNSKY